MSVMSDRWILDQCLANDMINPFVNKKYTANKVISYGISSYGYDARLSKEFHIFTNVHNSFVDPKNFDISNVVEVTKSDHIILPPHSFTLGTTVEYFKIPKDVIGICLGKSTYARCGLIVNVTPLEPLWEGKVTLELSNTTSNPIKVYVNEGICQFIFIKGDQACDNPYNKGMAKYMRQDTVTHPKV
ncbi:dCTP deaminase [Anaplasmataceae bacterium AB001_6]|nr:dCTP deaminase [Anaplasmataceae bacterium AB001_6]